MAESVFCKCNVQSKIYKLWTQELCPDEACHVDPQVELSKEVYIRGGDNLQTSKITMP